MPQTALAPRILVVEDERIVALHLRQQLAKLGFNVVATAASGAQALHHVAELHPDIVLMDIHLEGSIDGIETVNQMPPEYRASVIYLTANSEASTIERARATQPHGYLVKPFSERDLYITVTMVMERRCAELALQESEERLRLALDAAEMGSWKLETATGTFGPMGRANAIFGFSDRDFAGTWEALFDRLHADDRVVLAEAFDDALPDEVVRHAEFRSRAATGEACWLKVQGKAFRAPDQTRWIFGVVQDVTERRRRDDALAQHARELDSEIDHRRLTELALRKSEEAFRQLFQNTPVPMWAIDCESLRFLAVNDIAIASYGFRREEFLAMQITDLGVPADAERVSEKLRTGSAGGDHWPNETHRRKNGQSLLADIFLRAFVFDGRKALLAVALDVTERNAVAEQLRQAQKMEAVGQLTGGLAHDFNNLLAIICGNLELIRERPALDPQLREMLREASNAAERGARLTQRLLSFSRQQVLAPAIVDVAKVTSDLSSVLARLLEESIAIKIVMSPGLWMTRIDRAQLENALINLAINARDAMRTGGTLTIEAENTVLDQAYAKQHADLAAGPYVMLSVTDTGIGMPKEILDRTLEPFFTTKPVGHGTGLGLSMVYGFVKQSGGHLKIYSEVGRGTTVKLYLPQVPTEAGTSDRPAPAIRDARAKPDEVILVIEDDPAVRKLTVRFLTALGYSTIEAGDGPSGLDALDRAARVDLLLTDIVLPNGLDGPAIAKDARYRKPDLKVVFMTGYAPQGVREGEQTGDAGILSKPYSKSQLATVIRQSLDEAASVMPNHRLLIVDDEAAFANFVARVATEMNYDVEITTGPQAFMAAYERLRPDVLVLDIVMPEKDGNDLIHWLIERDCRARVIIVSGFNSLYLAMAKEIAEGLGKLKATTLAKPTPPAALRAALKWATPGTAELAPILAER